MPLDFFADKCQDGTSSQDITTAALFGLCDDRPRQRAYVEKDIASRDNWIATVINANTHEVAFTGIDNCLLITRTSGEIESRCDGMLTFASTIIFVELKEKSRGWLEEGIGQLETTIAIFFATHPSSPYTTHRAQLANSRHPRFPVARNTRSQQFRDKTGVTLLVETDIVL